MKFLSLLAIAGATGILAGCVSAPPTTPDPVVPDQTVTGSEAIVQADLDNAWASVESEFPEARRPDVEIVRFVDLDDIATTLADCLVDAGWSNVTATPDNGIDSGDVPTEQAEAYSVAYYTCYAMYPLNPRYNTPLSDDQVKRLYAYFRDELAPCLESRGFTVPAAPSEQQFIESYTTDGGWDLYGDVAANVNQNGWYEINTACPQYPSGLYD